MVLDTQINFKAIFKNKAAEIHPGEIRAGYVSDALLPPFGPAIAGYLKASGIQIELIEKADFKKALSEKRIDFIMLNVYDFASSVQELSLVPTFTQTVAGSLHYPRFFFKTGLKKIHTVAFNCENGLQLSLAKVLLRERYLSDPEYVPSRSSDPAEMLETADAAFISLPASSSAYLTLPESIDAGLELEGMTFRPFPYSVFAGIKNILSPEKKAAFAMIFDKLDEQKLLNVIDNPEFEKEYWLLSENLGTPGFACNQIVFDALQIFFNHLFYFGLIPEYPELELCI